MSRFTRVVALVLTALTIAIGVLVAGFGIAGTAIIASYGGMFGAVRCSDPTVSPCTGPYYFYGAPGYAPLVIGIAGLALAAIGVVVLLRSRPTRPRA